jgi:FkbM family methyltransferase
MLSKGLRGLRYRLFYGLALSRGFPLATLGAPESICKWTICPEGLNSKSVVYTGGLGRDISFEHALLDRFGCEMVLYDPSPCALETMARSENQIPQFHFFPTALAARNGKLALAPPLDPAGDSWFARDDGTAKIEVPCTDLSSLMAQNRHQHIDLLKLDIEGSEYEVIDDLLQRRIPIRQICVEFHHGILPGISRGQTIRSMLKLLRRGYKLLNQEGANHTFLRPGSWQPNEQN